MIKPFLKQLNTELKEEFTELGDRVYNNWPGPEQQEEYPYMVVFSGRAPTERFQYKKLREFTDKTMLYSLGYYRMFVDVNYLAAEGEVDDQLDLVDKMSDFFSIDLRFNVQKESEVSRDFSYTIKENYKATANVKLNGFELDQTGVDLQKGDRRSIFHLSCYVPRLKITKPGIYTGVVLDPVDISEKQNIQN